MMGVVPVPSSAISGICLECLGRTVHSILVKPPMLTRLLVLLVACYKAACWQRHPHCYPVSSVCCSRSAALSNSQKSKMSKRQELSSWRPRNDSNVRHPIFFPSRPYLCFPAACRSHLCWHWRLLLWLESGPWWLMDHMPWANSTGRHLSAAILNKQIWHLQQFCFVFDNGRASYSIGPDFQWVFKMSAK